MFFHSKIHPPSHRDVSAALEHFWDYAYLGNHPLAQMAAVTCLLVTPGRASHLERGRALSHLLQRAIDAMQVSPSRRRFSHEALYYPILCKAYVEGLDNTSVAHALNLSERTFYRQLAKATAVVAQLLDDWERAAQSK